MATSKKSTAKTLKAVVPPKPAPRKGAPKKSDIPEKAGELLVADNVSALSQLVESLGATLELLVQKVESMAHHVIASEEIIAELVAANGLNLAQVNNRIRTRIAAGTDNSGDANPTVDVAASIASPLPRR